MDDLISRQAAIDALQEEIDKGIPPFNDVIASIRCGVRLARNIIEDLPSAQPEPQWIPIERELPRDGSWNIFTDGKNISVERYKADAIDHFFPPGRWFQLEDVIAWMPLPKPFEGGTK